MKINLTELIDGQKNELDFTIEDSIEPVVYLGDEISFITPVCFQGSVYIMNDDAYIKGKIKCVAEFHCYRCLKKFKKSIATEIDEKLMRENDPELEEDDCFIIRNNMIDISKIIENTFILSFPMKVLCDENCKGLCPICGVDLNLKQCNCKEKAVDPRLAPLKDLLR